MTKKTRVLVVGRHAPDLGHEAETFEIVECRNVTFSLNYDECVTQLTQLISDASRSDASVLLQNTPGVVTAALADLVRLHTDAEDLYDGIGVGVIVAEPGPRQAGVSRSFEFKNTPASLSTLTAEQAVKFANARAQTRVESGTLTVTVDPIPEFKFRCIRWL